MTTKSVADQTQETLLQRYCAEVENAMAEAPDAAAASTIRDELCNRFAQECGSELIVNATREYVNRIIADRWREQPDATDSPRNTN